MKIGFSSLVCPGWDLSTIVAKASEYGFDGIELRGLRGELTLTRVPELSGNPGATRQMLNAAGVELVCLASSCSFASRDRRKLAQAHEELCEYIETAERLGCPFVRMFMGDVQGGEARQNTLSRIAGELTKIAPFAAEHKVTILVENSNDFAGSGDMWFVCDSAAHPAVRVCWNPCTARTGLERPTTSIPRLGMKIGLFHVCDGVFDDQGYMSGGYVVPGEGDVEIARSIELLKGVCYDDYLVFEWPKLWDSSLPLADSVLPGVATFLRERIDEKQVILSAYKNDKNAPKYRAALATAPARPN